MSASVPPPDQPAVRRSRGSRRGLAIGLTCAVAVVIAVVVLLRNAPAGVPAAGGPVTSPTPSGPPTRASATPGRDGPHTGLTPRSSRLYNVAYTRGSATCATRQERPPLPDAWLVAHLQQLSDCLVELNREPLAAQGITLTRPMVKGFQVQADTACGVISRYAFYCPEDRSIYVDLRSDDNWRFYGGMRLGYFAVITHEFGHHLQLAGGITEGYADLMARAGDEQRLELSRRSELQATCFSAVAYGALWRSVGATERDVSQLLDYFDRNNDEVTREGTHGNSRTMRDWFHRGLGERTSSYDSCNTWVAAPDQVD
ncbi:hypothetical protein CGZ93_12420 [Enemella dayhoffiae]|uniref:Metalloprotease n=1 Tax=Enemella dayhoffiae TaxID=2016507 RepID=A0A255GZE8_9ACTN|nr:neutral zinc metallopeptidase [Enemella dayhoffiae]OYO21000.1 hypothetical protein CGZ93_12420 [Enemella dayhoffiae]